MKVLLVGRTPCGAVMLIVMAALLEQACRGSLAPEKGLVAHRLQHSLRR